MEKAYFPGTGTLTAVYKNRMKSKGGAVLDPPVVNGDKHYVVKCATYS